MRLFSYRNRPVHLGPYPLERLPRQDSLPDLGQVPPMRPLSFVDPNPESLTNAMRRYIGMFDAVRDGTIGTQRAEIPDDPQERTNHLKAAGYYFDSTQIGTCALPAEALLDEPIRNPVMAELAEELSKGQPKSFASGIDAIYADVLDSARATPKALPREHRYALVFLVEYTRDPRPDEPGAEWIRGTQPQRAAVLTAQTAALISSYLRLLGFEARAHTATCSDVDLGKLAVAAGLARVERTGEGAVLVNPYVGARFGLAAVTTSLEIAPDKPLASPTWLSRVRSHGPAWWTGKGTLKNAFNFEPYGNRELRMGEFPFEKLKRRDTPTTFIDTERVPRFPKRSDFFARALFGDMGKNVQDAAKNGMYVAKSPIGACARRALGALLLLQFGDARGPVSPSVRDPKRNADNIKAASYYLGSDAVGLSAAPSWVYYSHDAGGNPMPAYHKNALSILIDQGHETMAGASGDDWISAAQSMRAYLRFSLLGGIVGEQMRRLGYSARVHSVLDGDVLQPPLLLLAGLGEVSRIGEVILNPYLGPRLKSGVVTTDMPMEHDKPIDFGLQRFCEGCNKCARECPSGAITAGPKLMYNGYEIWKSDSERCARYRLTNRGGSMCGRCMKTCPWNLEGLFADATFRWFAMKTPQAARLLAWLDDLVGRGAINPVKKWWWDLDFDQKAKRYIRAAQTHIRGINPRIKLKYEEQSLAVYPADKVPPPYPIVFPLNREEGIERYRAMLTPEAYKERLRSGETDNLVPQFSMPPGDPPVFPVILKKREDMTEDAVRYEFVPANGGELPPFEAGSHVDVVIAPEYQRQFSLAGDPADRSRYVLGVLREHEGRGGSLLMHRIFREGRRVMISPPRNHFGLDETAKKSFLFAGGIGVTPMLTMAYRLHELGADFELHYCAHSRKAAGFLSDIEQAKWHNRVSLHFTDEGSRADFERLVPRYFEGAHLYACGSPRYMDAVYAAAEARGWPEGALHKEYFSVPEAPDYVNHSFRVRLARSGRTVEVPADKAVTEALSEIGINIETKCSDGICGICAAHYVSGDVEHRDFVLSARDRESRMILCCSRAKEPDGVIVLDL